MIQRFLVRVLCDTVCVLLTDSANYCCWQTTVQPQNHFESWKPPQPKRSVWERFNYASALIPKRKRIRVRRRRFSWHRALAQVSTAPLLVTGAIVMSLALGVSFAIGMQIRTQINYGFRQKPLFASAPINVFHLPPMEIFWISPEELQRRAAQLFATSDSVGTVALGAAEGTRTRHGHKTPLWKQHIDPGNGAINKGTFSWQLGAKSAEEADHKGLSRIQTEAIPQLIQAAVQERVGFDMETLVQGADLWNQSPDAGASFVQNLKQCLRQNHASNTELLLCARSQSFYNPTTGELEASGFDGDPDWLEADQARRIAAIQEVLQTHQEQLLAEFSHAAN
jgi:hypothetical protein